MPHFDRNHFCPLCVSASPRLCVYMILLFWQEPLPWPLGSCIEIAGSVRYVAMVKEFEVYIDRLKDGHTQKVNESVDPSFLDIEEQELRFPTPVSVCGDVYLAEDHLILHLKVKTEAHVPCVICNDLFANPILVDFYYTVPPEELVKPIFDYTEALREIILLEIPTFAECHEGKCPEREATSKYLKKETTSTDPHTQFPFSDL